MAATLQGPDSEKLCHVGHRQLLLGARFLSLEAAAATQLTEYLQTAGRPLSIRKIELSTIHFRKCCNCVLPMVAGSDTPARPTAAVLHPGIDRSLAWQA